MSRHNETTAMVTLQWGFQMTSHQRDKVTRLYRPLSFVRSISQGDFSVESLVDDELKVVLPGAPIFRSFKTGTA